jgi:hypothetical protein
MPGSDLDIDLFRSLEQALHRPEVRGSRTAVEALLAGSFVEIGSSGRVYDRATVLDGMVKERSAGSSSLPEVLDFAAQILSPDIVLVTYRSVERDREVLRSSIWKQAEGTWQMLFHQGTIVPAAR